jgi:hypothetical protein
MRKELVGKILVLGIICLFIGVGVQPALAIEPKLSADNKTESVEDCDCKEEDRPNLFLVKLWLNKVEVLTNILLLRFGYIPEVKENCELVLEGISSIDITRDFEVLCEILYTILAPISNLMVSLFQLISSGIFIGFIALLISIFIVSLGMAVGDLLNCWWV